MFLFELIMLCKYFSKKLMVELYRLGTELVIPRQSKEEAEAEMQNLINMAQHTAVRYAYLTVLH